MEENAVLEVDVVIDTSGAFANIERLYDQFDAGTVRVLQQIAQVERATGGMMKLGPAKAEVVSYGAVTTNSMKQAEKAGEGMVRQLQRQIETFGKTAAEVRALRAEQKALNAEQKGFTELAGRIRAASAEITRLETSTGGIVRPTQLAGHHMQNLAFQAQDLGIQLVAAAGSSAPLKMAFMALMQQGSQIYGIMGQAGIGIRGVGAAFAAMSKSILLATVTNPILLGIAAAITAVVVGIKALQSAANSGEDMNAYAKSLGLTAKEIRNLDNVTVTFGDTAKAIFQVAGRAIWDNIGGAVTSAWETMKEWVAWIASGAKYGINMLIGAHVAAFNTISKTWRMFPAVLGDVFLSGVNAAIEAINALVRKAIDGINTLGAQANRILPSFLQIPALTAPQIDKVKNQFAGAAAKAGKTFKDEFGKAAGTDYLGNVGGAIVDQARKNAQDRIRKQAEDKGYFDDSGKTDKHAAALARDAAATEAQIRNLYALADAYRVSGAAALIAEARVKAETQAIKQRADIEAAVDRQIRLAIAQRVSDAAKSTASMRDQANVQAQVNAQVAAGNVPAARAADLVRDQIADLPLLAALQAAQQRGMLGAAMAATRALDDQRRAREALFAVEQQARFNSAMEGISDRLEELREERRLIGASNVERERALALIRAQAEARRVTGDPAQQGTFVSAQMSAFDLATRIRLETERYNEELRFTAERWDLIATNIQNAARGMADAFGAAGRAIGDMAAIYAGFSANRARLDAEYKLRVKEANGDRAAIERANQRYALQTATAQIGLYGDMTNAAKGFFKEGSTGYKTLEAAEKAFRAVEFALSVRAMAQDAVETVSAIAKSGARAAAHAVEAVAKAIASLPFPLNLAAGAATAAALVSIGLAVGGAFGGSGAKPAPSNSGTGTVLGSRDAKSESIKNAIDALRQVDTLTLSYSRQMAASLKSIESQIGGFASVLVRQQDGLNASGGVTEGFKKNTIGSILGAIPLVGGLLGSLFGTKTTVVGSGLYGGPQSLGSVLNGGFDASYYSDVQKKKKFLGITTGTSYSTQYAGADGALENQFTLILRQFNDAILASAGPLGIATGEIQNRLNNFVISIGKIDLQGLSGEQIEEKLSAIFGAAADQMAAAAVPGLLQFQKVGEGMFETLVRVSSTIEAVSGTLDLLGNSVTGMSMAAKLGLADQFESLSDLTSAADAYFQAFYTQEEQAAARRAQLTRVFNDLGMSLPSSISGFRALVEAQDLTTSAGQAAYAMLLQLAPAFADLQGSLEGVRSAADIASERLDLQRQLLELRGDTAALRAMELAKVDASNRALQVEIWAIQDAQKAAQAAEQLREAWSSVGKSITDEVNRIRGITGNASDGGFAATQARFNAAVTAARMGDQDAARNLPGLSQALLQSAAANATSRQELMRIQAQTAAALERTQSIIAGFNPASVGLDGASLINAGANAQSVAENDNSVFDLRASLADIRDEVAEAREAQMLALATIAGNTGRVAKKLEDVTSDSGGNAISIVQPAA